MLHVCNIEEKGGAEERDCFVVYALWLCVTRYIYAATRAGISITMYDNNVAAPAQCYGCSCIYTIHIATDVYIYSARHFNR